MYPSNENRYGRRRRRNRCSKRGQVSRKRGLETQSRKQVPKKTKSKPAPVSHIPFIFVKCGEAMETGGDREEVRESVGLYEANQL